MKKSVKILLSVATFAYDPYTCSLQNLKESRLKSQPSLVVGLKAYP
ncbi:hypothetical protein QBO45_000112 [Campylobacter coli]|nr:hypothetical protein [Campylobacter coli]EKS2623060.1 hypothetical protein [Campylobacter coli]